MTSDFTASECRTCSINLFLELCIVSAGFSYKNGDNLNDLDLDHHPTQTEDVQTVWVCFWSVFCQVPAMLCRYGGKNLHFYRFGYLRGIRHIKNAENTMGLAQRVVNRRQKPNRMFRKLISCRWTKAVKARGPE